MNLAIRRLDLHEMGAVARIHRISFDATLPWLAGLQTPEEDLWFFREKIFPAGPVWGAFDPDLVGFVAMEPGWIEQFYLLPDHQRRGIGSALMAQAKRDADQLQLWAFQRNTGARAFYERHGFVAVEHTDGMRNEEREPDVRYCWP